MRRESALAQGCAIADGHGGRPVSEGSGGSGHTPAAGLLRAKSGTGLIIPAPIWREGRDSPSGLRSHGWRSEAFPLNPPPPTAGWQLAIAYQGRNRSNTNPTPKYASRWRSSARVRARILPQDPGMRPQRPGARRWAA